MKTALILTAALGIAPPVVERPQAIFVNPNSSFTCNTTSGCVVFNEAGLETLLKSVEQKTLASCRTGI